MGFDRLPVVVKLSDKVEVETFRQVPILFEPPRDAIGVSDIGTISAAKVTPKENPNEAFIAVSMYARWLRSHPLASGKWIVSTNSAHRIISDLAAFVGKTDPATHRILAGGDLNMIYGGCDELGVWRWDRTIWDRFQSLGLEFMGPQQPNGRPPEPGIVPADVPDDTRNVPTHYKKGNENPQKAATQLDYVFASRGFHNQVSVRAMNGIDEWGPSDHCRLMIELEI